MPQTKLQVTGMQDKSDAKKLIEIGEAVANVKLINANFETGVDADMVGETLYYGAGAGALPTASAVVADIIDISRLITADADNRVPHLAFQPSQVKAQNMVAMDDITSSYYLRVQAEDKPGALGQIATLLAEEGVSIEALIQKGVIDQTTAEIVILTHSAVEKQVKSAITKIEALAFVDKPIVMIRMESLHGQNG